MITYKCDSCKKVKEKEETRTIVIHPRDRKIWTKFPIQNPNRKKFGTRLFCVDCLKDKLDYQEEKQ